nr:hypothetical protein [Tanacetum cinerariifolium]
MKTNDTPFTKCGERANTKGVIFDCHRTLSPNVPEIYMHEFWATTNVHQHSIRFKMDNKKHILDIESFMNMLHISPKVQGQTFTELPFEEEILEFIRFLGHSATIRTPTDVNINKLYQPWRSFAGLYHKRNINYAFLIWEDFVYQVEHKNHKKSNEMYYPRFTKVIIHHFISKDPSIPRRNKVNWHYVRDDFLFSMIKVVSKHQNTQQYGAMLPIELINDDIRNTKEYKDYYAFATGEAVPKPKASIKRKRSDSDTSITPPTATPTLKPTDAATPRLTATAKGKQLAKATKAKSLSAPSEVARTKTQQLKIVLKRSRQQMHISQPGGSGTYEGTGADDQGKDGDDDEGDDGDESDEGEEDADEDKDGDQRDDDEENQEVSKFNEQDNDEGGGDDEKEGESDEEDDNEETREEESFDPIPETPEGSEDKGDSEEDQGLNVNKEEHVEEEKEDKLYRDVNINQGRGLQATLEVKYTHVTLTLINSNGQQESSLVSSQFVTSMLNPISDVGMESIFATASSSVAPLHTSTPIMTPSIIATITTISQAPIPLTPIPSEVLQNLPTFALVFRFDDRLKSLEANFSEYRQTNPFVKAVSAIPGIRIIKEQVKGQVKEQVSKVLPRIKQSVNAQLEAEVLTRLSHSSRTSYAIAADLSEMELKKILIEKMEGNKSIQCSDEQRNLYKTLVNTYEADKIILDSYGETVILKRRRDDDDDDDKDEGPSTGSDQRSKRQREGKEPKSASAPLETTTRSAGSELAKQADSCSSFNELLDTPLDFSNFIINQLRVDTLTPKLLAGPTYELMKGSCTSLIELEYHLEEVYKETTDQLDWVNPEGQQYPHNLLQPLSLTPNNRGRRVIPFAQFINNDLEYLQGGASSLKYTTSVTKTKAADYRNIKCTEDLVPRTMWIQERIDYDKYALWEVSHWGRKRQQFYCFAVNRKFALDVYSKRRIIAVTNLKIVEWHSYKHLDWILLSNLTIEERFTFNVSLRMFTRSIVIQRHVEDLQLGVESYQKRLNLTKPDTDGTLNDVRTALDDRLKGIRIQYFPQTIWRKEKTEKLGIVPTEMELILEHTQQGISYEVSSVNAQLEVEVLTRLSHSSRTSYAIADDLSEMELKKILIEKMEGNKSIQCSDEQRNLYKTLVNTYEADKIILDSYGETIILKRRRDDDDDDKDEGPSTGSDQRSKRRREGKEPESTSTPLETATRSAGSCLRKHSNMDKRTGKQADSRSSFSELLDTSLDFSNFIMNQLRVDTLTPKLLAGPTYELMKGSCQQYPHNLLQPLLLTPNNRGRRVIPFAHIINNDLEYLQGGASSLKYTTSVTKTKAADYENIKCTEDLVPRTMWIQERIDYDKYALWEVSHWGRKRQQFYCFVVNREFALDVYSKRRIIAVTNLKIVEWHSYKHLDWILLSNLTIEERFTFNVSLRMFTRSIVIQRRVEDLQLGVESYQKRLNLTKPDTYWSDLKRRKAYTAYSNSRGFIYQNKDKKNRLMQIDELHKFSDGTLNDVRTAIDDRLKGIRMQYLPQTIWRKGDKDRLAAMIQAID